MVLDASLLSAQQLKRRIKGKWSNPGRKSGALPYLRVDSYRKGSLRVAPDCGRKLTYFTILEVNEKKEKYQKVIKKKQSNS